jgi:3-hydroxyacyl-CoA dehydrogenase
LSEEVAGILKNRDWAARMVALRSSDDPQAQFLWAVHRDVFHYAAVNLGEIADNARDLDLAVRWGFGWKQGPFEIWQMAGWRQVSDWIREDISAGRTMADVPLPGWVDEVDGVHRQEGSWSAAASGWRARSDLPVYRRQLFPDTVVGEAAADPGTTVFETENGVRLWHRGDDIAIVSITSKMHAIGDEVLDGLLESVEIAERDFSGLVIWQPKEPFSVGANLLQAIEIAQAKGFDAVEELVHKFQRATGRLRNSSVPVVGAARGLALGGGCEVLLHCDRVVAALESYIGLVEVGVGLIPAGGGCKERALRAAQQAPDDNLFPFVRQAFETIAMGKVAKSAEEAKELGLLRDSDIIVFNPHEVLHVAVEQARAMAEAGYRPPLPRKVPVLGRPGVATLEAAMVNMREGGFISEHDYLIGRKVALALCGGDVDPGTLVDEEWLLVQERKAFVELAQMPKTQERIVHMLQTGKPLRN